MEVGLDIDNDYDLWNPCEKNEQKQPPTFYGKIFSLETRDLYASLRQRVSSGFTHPKEILLVCDPRGKVEAGFTYRWGGKDGPKGSAHVEGEIKDKHGNYVRGEARAHSDGEKEVRGKAGNDQKDKKKKDK